ncbi:hypothetical protein KQI65_00465 [bacterium]|nr:hypothetical protein [bacterium]
MQNRKGKTALHRYALLIILNVLLLLLFSTVAVEAAQRMGLLKGSYRLSPRMKKDADAFCMDHTRDAPNVKTRYHYLLTDRSKAFVRIEGDEDDRVMPLQTAMDQGILRIRGRSISLKRFIKRVSEALENDGVKSEFISEAREMVKDYYTASRVKRQRMELQYADQLEAFGDHKHLVIENLTDDTIELVLLSSAVFGEEDEGLGLIKAVDLEDTQSQDDVWEKVNRRHLEQFRDAGYAGAVPWIASRIEEMKALVSEFQKEMAIEVSGKLDRQTENALYHAAEEQRIVSRFNQDSPHYTYIVLEEVPEGRFGEFIAYLGKEEGIYRGPSMIDLMHTVKNLFPMDSAGGTLYLDLSRFTPERAREMEEKAREAQKIVCADVPTVPYLRSQFPSAMQAAVFEGGVDITIGPLEQLETDPVKKQFRAPLTLSTKDEIVYGALCSENEEVLETYVERLLSCCRETQLQHAPAEYINHVRQEVKKEKGDGEGVITVEVELPGSCTDHCNKVRL